MSDGEFVFVYSTFPDREAAEKIGRELVQSRLAACVNIFPPMTSLFEWEGRIDSSIEHAVFIKTHRDLAERAIEAARPLHPYTIPCFLILPIASGNEDYLSWARQQTATA
jgi:periplasmic divalent cation tolerance protein